MDGAVRSFRRYQYTVQAYLHTDRQREREREGEMWRKEGGQWGQGRIRLLAGWSLLDGGGGGGGGVGVGASMGGGGGGGGGGEWEHLCQGSCRESSHWN